MAANVQNQRTFIRRILVWQRRRDSLAGRITQSRAQAPNVGSNTYRESPGENPLR